MASPTIRKSALGLAAVLVVAPQGGRTETLLGGWQGRYLYTHDGDPTAGGSRTVVEHVLRLGRAGGRTGCMLESRGFPTDERILCRQSPSGYRTQVRFVSYGDGRVVNRYGVERYKPGAALFIIERQAGALVTTWEALTPGERIPPGRYFTLAR